MLSTLRNSKALISFGPRAVFICLMVLSSLTAANAQSMGNAQDTIDSRLRTSARVDPTTQAMQLQISLGNYQGRNGLNMPITLSYSSKVWQIKYQGTRTFGPPGGQETDSTYQPSYGDGSASGWISNLDGDLFAQQPSIQLYDGTGVQMLMGRKSSIAYHVARMFAILPDGSRHEMRRDDNLYNAQFVFDPSGTYYSVDGSQLRYETSTGILYFPDGSRIYTTTDVNSGFTSHRVDRNGNSLIYNSGQSGVWTDTLGRTFNLPLASRLGQTYSGVGDYTYTVPGVNGTTLSYTLRWRNLSDVRTDPSQQLRYAGDGTQGFPHQPVSPSLFGSFDSTETVVADSTVFNPVVLYQISLPNGGAYTFTYNVWGEIDKVVYPTGGYETFSYGAVAPAGGMIQPSLFAQGNRGVYGHCLSASGTGADLACSQYATQITGPYPNQNFEASVIAPDGTMSIRTSFNNTYNQQPARTVAFGFDDPLAGKEYEERFYSAPVAGNRTLLRRKLTKWTVDGTSQILGNGSILYKTRNPRVTKEIEILFDTGGDALTKTTTYAYDQDLNLISTSQYDYSSMNATTAQTATIDNIATGVLVRTTQTTYLVNDPNISSTVQASYRALNLLALPSKTSVLDGAGTVVAQTLYQYDEAAYPLITYGSVTNWTDPGQYRGNVTTIQRLLSPSSNTYVTTHIQYDQTGNPCISTDALGNVSQVAYSSAYSYALPTQTISAIPDPTNRNGSNIALTTSSVYDLSTGLPTSSTDANGQTTTYTYNDSLNRLTLVTRPTGGGATAYNYGDTPGNLYIRSQTSLDSTRIIEQYSFFDGAGRPIRSFLNEGGTYITSDIQYDLMGRTLRKSNPYRVNSLTDPINPTGLWTTNSYDDLGRVTTVTATDGSQVRTTFSGNQVTVTDQAGKSRRSVSDGLGRLVQVVEDPAGLNYLTSYSYDTLDNLTTVAQCGAVTPCNLQTPGAQVRTFAYDSLKRLASTTNPESGTISYSYDANGNLLYKASAGGIYTLFTYDSLNRVIRKSYGTSPTGKTLGTKTLDQDSLSSSNIAYFYDVRGSAVNAPTGFVAVNSLGRLVAVEANGGYTANIRSGRYYGYDNLGRTASVIAEVRGTFYANSATYDQAGGIVSETYPLAPGSTDQRIINYAYDTAGRNVSVSSIATSYAAGASTSNITYAPHGGMISETYGTTTPLLHSLSYNNRLQPTEIMLGTNAAPKSTLDLSYGYDTGNNDNNGNILQASVNIPQAGVSQGAHVFQQSFTYDGLNRLATAMETDDLQTPAWQQAYGYDAFGNRSLLAGGVQGGIPDITFNGKNQIVGRTYDADGNLTSDGQHSYTYDTENRMACVDFVPARIITIRPPHSTPAYCSSSYLYDGEGHRIRTSATNLRMIYGINGQLIAEFDDTSGALKKEYIYGANGLLATIIPGASGDMSKVQYQTADHLGSPRITVYGNGAVESRHDYMPFGEDIPSTGQGSGVRSSIAEYSGNDGERQKFTAKERDTETGLDYFEARYYGSNQGRFTSTDPLEVVLGRQGADDKKEAEKEFRSYLSQPQHWNRYTYCLNNPLRFIDPDGFNPLVIDVNIVWDANSKYSDAEKDEIRKTYIAEAIENFAGIDIQLNVTESTGTASRDQGGEMHWIATGAKDRALNVFFSKQDIGTSTEHTYYNEGTRGKIFIQTVNCWPWCGSGDLTHGMVHALGIDEHSNKGYLGMEEGFFGYLGQYFSTKNYAEQKTVAVTSYLYDKASLEGHYDPNNIKWGHQLSREISIIKNTAKNYVHQYQSHRF